MKNYLYLLILYLIVLLAGLFPQNAIANSDKCEMALANTSSEHQSSTDSWETLYKQSDLSPRPQLWLRIRQALQKNVNHLEHPLESAGHNPDQLASVYHRMSAELPILKQLMIVTNRIDQGTALTHEDFIQLKRSVANKLISVSKKPHSDLEVFAALEALRLLSTIESRIEFPHQTEETTIPKKEEKPSEEKKTEEDGESAEEEPEWNTPQDQYQPEQKDLSNQSKSKKKNVDLVLTDAPVHKRLMRQKIYDQFSLTQWSTAPSQREPIEKEKKPSQKLIINPLGATSIDVPLPYGYTLIPGKYAHHRIAEIGPGEFKVLVSSKDPVTLELVRIQKEAYLPTITPKSTMAEHRQFWPPHLLLFTESLKGLNPIEAATILEKYISDEGGFLYYSKGDKIKAEDLNRLDQKYSELLTRMPKPIAMANVGAFNCDGAAWIGALLLRDVLNLPVRIAGGKTSAGTKTINDEKLNVVKSADPNHAWIEVFDGNRWVPFDMTPIHNTPDSASAPTDVEREQEERPKETNKQELKKEHPDKSKNEDRKSESENAQNKDGTRQDSETNPEESKTDDRDQKQKSDHANSEDNVDTDLRKIEDLIQSKSTQRSKNESNLGLIDRVLNRNELIFLEQLITDGHQTSFQAQSLELLNKLAEQANWKNPVERSRVKMATFLHDAKFAKYQGLQSFLSEARLDLTQNNARQAKQKFLMAQRLLLALSDYRNLAPSEINSLHSIEKMLRLLDQIKHKSSKEFDAVEQLLTNLPGHVSKTWLAKQYGNDYDKLGSSANINLAQDLISGKLKPLLQMAAVRDFVDMTLNSTEEPQWKDESTLNRSLVPKPRQDLIITRNPLDFAKMLWNLRPGEAMFAPTLQGRQFAMGSLETRRVVNPKNPLERKVSVVYYDISGSMLSAPIETQDALLMAFVDRALSEVDAIGRPIHEVYLIPFGDKRYEGVHIASRDDALSFIAKMMSYRTSANEGNAYTKFVEEFYELVASSYAKKSAQGREKIFQKANMVLLTDGIYEVDINSIAEARKKLPPGVEINLNFVSIGDQVNEALQSVASSNKIAAKKPTFRQVTSKMINAVSNLTTQYDPEAFATNQRITGKMLEEIDSHLRKIEALQPPKPNLSQITQTLTQVKVAEGDISKLPGLREAINLTQLGNALSQTSIDAPIRQRLMEAILESYQQLTGRSWTHMTYPEKDAFEKLKEWIH